MWGRAAGRPPLQFDVRVGCMIVRGQRLDVPLNRRIEPQRRAPAGRSSASSAPEHTAPTSGRARTRSSGDHACPVLQGAWWLRSLIGISATTASFLRRRHGGCPHVRRGPPKRRGPRVRDGPGPHSDSRISVPSRHWSSGDCAVALGSGPWRLGSHQRGGGSHGPSSSPDATGSDFRSRAAREASPELPSRPARGSSSPSTSGARGDARSSNRRRAPPDRTSAPEDGRGNPVSFPAPVLHGRDRTDRR